MSKYKETVDKILAINRNDRKKLFGFTTEKEMIQAIKDNITTVMDIKKVLKWYEEEYKFPFWTGDIVKDKDDEKWIITCVYTDNSIDLISESKVIKRKNCGMLSSNLVKVGKLEKIWED